MTSIVTKVVTKIKNLIDEQSRMISFSFEKESTERKKTIKMLYIDYPSSGCSVNVVWVIDFRPLL